MKVLLVDDDEIARAVAKKILQSEQHEIILAEDGAEALEILHSTDIKLVISDWNMPRVDGIELCRQVRTSFQNDYIYIILVTERSSRTDRLSALSSGADDFISKPIIPEELLARVHTAQRLLDTQKNLRQSEQRNIALLDAVPDSIFRIRRDGLLLDYKSGFTSILNLTGSQIHGLSINSIFPESHLENARASIELALASEEIQYLEYKLMQGESAHFFEARIKKSGLDEVTAIIRDISERVRLNELVQAQTEQLTTSEALYRSLFDNINSIIVIFDLHNGMILDANPAACAYFNKSYTELLQTSMTNLVSISQAEMGGHAAQILSGQKIFMEASYSRPDGETRLLGVYPSVFHFKKRGSAILAVIHDITEQKKSQQQIAFQASLLEQVHNGVIVIDLDNTIQYWNSFAEELYQWKSAEAIGKKIIDLLAPEEMKTITLQNFDQLNREGHWEGEYNVRRKDGSSLPVYILNTQLKDSSGQHLGFIGISFDVSRRKQLEQALIESEQRFHGMLDNMQEGVLLLGQDWRYLYINKAAEIQGGRPASELLGRSVMECWPGIEATEFFQIEQKVMQSHEPAQVEAPFTFPDGTVRWFRWIIQPAKEGLLVITMDITRSIQEAQELQQAERKYRMLAENSPDSIYIVDVTAHKTIYSSRETLLGFTLAELEAPGSILSRVHPDDSPAVQAHFQKILQGVDAGLLEYRIQLKDGRWEWVQTRERILTQDTNGQPAQVLITLSVITERKQAETALLESEALFRASFENATIGVSLVSSTGRFIKVNSALCAILGYSAEELLTMKFNDLTYPDDLEIGPKEMKKLINGQAEHVSLEKRYIHKDGHVLWVFLSFSLIRDQAGEVKYYVTHTQDITERKQLMDTLRQRSAAIEASPTSIVITDADGKIEYANPKFTQVTGYTLQEAINNNPRIIQSGKTPLAVYQQLWETIQTGKEWHGEFLNKKKNGELYYESASISPIQDENGKISHYVAVKEDITEKKHVQQRVLEALAFNQTILETSPIGIVIYNHNGDCISANRAAALIIGTDQEQLLKGNIHTIESWKACGLYAAALEALKTGKPISLQVHYLSSFGKMLWLEATFATFQTDGNTHLLYMFGDNSERQKAEELLKLSNDKLEVLVRDLESSNKEADLLRQMSDMLQICNGVQEAYAVVEQFAPQIFTQSAGAIYTANPQRQVVEAVCTWGEDLFSESIFAAEDCLALRRGRMYESNSTQRGLKCQHMEKNFPGSYLDVPLMASGETLGLLHLENAQAQECPHSKQVLAQNLADNVALSLSNIRLRESLHEQSVRDPLTHTFNRRFMLETLERELPRARRKKSHVGVIMLDIDHFKHFNDTYGHPAGDLVLTSLAELLQSTVRGEDVVCRMGGEEFLLILPDANREVTLQRAESIRLAVQTIDLTYDNQHLGTISVSLGVAIFPIHGADSAEILERVDAALYRAKNTGRNRVEEAVSPVS